MKNHTLFFSKIGKDVSKFSSAAVVIGAVVHVSISLCSFSL